MKTIGDGRKFGRSTGLRVGQFANAVIHSLCSHVASERRRTGIVLPINQDTWRRIFELEFPARYQQNGRSIQTLMTYCGYYNGGTHKLGYDKQQRFDFGTGQRKYEQGMSVARTSLAARPGGKARVEPSEAIALARQLWERHERGHNPPDPPPAERTRPLNPSTIPETILRAVGTILGDDRAKTFSRDDVRRVVGVSSKVWGASYSPNFQGMRVDHPGGAPTVGRKFQKLFRRVAHGKYILTERGSQLVFGESITEELAQIAREVDESGYFHKDTRKRRLQEIVVRQGQPAFRDKLLVAYGQRCAVTGFDALEALEAAHIRPYSGPESNRISNGLLLRSDIHNLFDLGLLSIHPTKLIVLLHPRLRASSYREFHRKPLLLPDNPAHHPARRLLEEQFQRFFG